MKKNSRKEALFNASFKLFLLNQYSGVSLKMIEDEAHITRGTIFYYAKNKEDLFRQVVKYFWLDKQNIYNKMDVEPMPLKDFIVKYTESIGRTMTNLKSLLAGCTVQQASQAYLSFLMQLRHTAPDLHDEYLSNRVHELTVWNNILEGAVKSGEIRNDINCFATAETFVYNFYGMTFWDCLDSGLNSDHLRRLYMAQYKLLLPIAKDSVESSE